MNERGWEASVNAIEGLKDESLGLSTSLVGESLPQVVVVAEVVQILGVNRLDGDVSSEDDGSELLHFKLDLVGRWVEHAAEKEAILVWGGKLGIGKLLFSSLSGGVVVGEDLAEDSGDFVELFWGKSVHLCCFK